MATFKMKQNDTSPDMVYVIDTPGISLTGANIVMNMKPSSGGSLKINRREVFSIKDEWDSSGGPEILVVWQTDDTDTVGTFEFEFEIELADGKVETVPNDRNETLVITDDIG